MSMTDPIADMLTRIRNAGKAHHQKVEVPFSNIKFQIAKILKEEKYLKNIKVITENNKRSIRIFLKYDEKNTHVISVLKRVSKPGLRVYVGKDEIPSVLGGLGITILSTSKGIINDRGAKKLNIGGEIICSVW